MDENGVRCDKQNKSEGESNSSKIPLMQNADTKQANKKQPLDPDNRSEKYRGGQWKKMCKENKSDADGGLLEIWYETRNNNTSDGHEMCKSYLKKIMMNIFHFLYSNPYRFY